MHAGQRMQEEPKWLEKYQRHDLKVTKGDLDGLSPYLVAQITAVNTSRSGGATHHRLVSFPWSCSLCQMYSSVA